MEIDIKTDSRKVKPGDTFIAIRNVERDGHDYIESAIKNGASKVIVEEGNYPVETIKVKDTRKYLNKYLYNNYYSYISDMNFVGVTGTNGKTTICFMMYKMLRMLGKKVAYMGTIGFYYNDEYLPMVNTTPDVDVLYSYLLKAKDAGCETIIMEVSSHALAKNRIYGLEYDEVAFTNLTQDHLDFHKTIDNYIKAKQQLFLRTRNDKIAIINGDDKYSDKFIFKDNKNIIISKNDADLTIKNISYSHLGTSFTFVFNNKTYTTTINMVGKYNVYNYLTAMLLSYYLGIDIEDLLTCNDKLQAPEGRMELIKYQGNSIFIDFAHTPDGMKNVLEATKDFNVDKVITIFGCGGNRDKTKRPIMGEIACKNSTKVIITNDNPRHEKPLDIINDITKDLNYSNYEVIPDRKEAIKRGMSLLNGNDVLMLLGKGHEQYEIIGDEKIHYNDKEEVYKYMNKDKKIAFFDVDGTLLDVPNGMVHPTSKTVEALTQFQKEGNYIVVASARGVIPDSLNVIDFDGLVGCDGHYIEFHHDIYIDNKFSVEEMKMMDKVAKENNGSYIFSGHYGEWLMDPRDPLIRKHQTIYLGTPEPARGYDFKWEYSDVKSNVATIIFNNANDMYQALKQLPKDWAINAYDEDHIRMDIHKQGFSKGTGCMYLANQLGISQENTYAFGDGFNDREMLKLVSHGQAMGNAVKELEGYYDEKIDSVDNDGIYKYFKKNLL